MSPAPSSVDIRAEFLRFLTVEKGLSPNTREAYGLDIDRFLRFLAREKTSWDRARESDLAAFIRHESRAGLSARSPAASPSSRPSTAFFFSTAGWIKIPRFT